MLKICAKYKFVRDIKSSPMPDTVLYRHLLKLGLTIVLSNFVTLGI